MAGLDILDMLTSLSEDDPRIAALKRLRQSSVRPQDVGTVADNPSSFYQGDPSLGGFSPRDVLSNRIMQTIGEEDYDPGEPAGFEPKFAPGEFNPAGQRRAEMFRRYVGDSPGTDSEVEMAYGGEALGPEDQYMMHKIPSGSRFGRRGPARPRSSGEDMQDIMNTMDEDAAEGMAAPSERNSIPSRRTPQTTEQELEDVNRQMDSDAGEAGRGQLMEDQQNLIADLEDISSGGQGDDGGQRSDEIRQRIQEFVDKWGRDALPDEADDWAETADFMD